MLAAWGDGQFTRAAHGLEVDPEDNVWVVDVDLHQVYKFNHQGDLLMTMGTKGTPGLGPEHFNQPTDVAVAENGEIYVADGYVNSRVVKFSPEGQFLFDWGQKGDQPGNWTPSRNCGGSPGKSLCCRPRERSNPDFRRGRNLSRAVDQTPNEASLGLDIGSDGALYVADGGDLVHRGKKERILRFSPEGNLLDHGAPSDGMTGSSIGPMT